MVAKLVMVGLKPEVADRYPSELSGGMVKRVALARARARSGTGVLDEPTSGLDPIGAGDFDDWCAPCSYFGPDRFHGNPTSTAFIRPATASPCWATGRSLQPDRSPT
jgi:hypothetical protein